MITDYFKKVSKIMNDTYRNKAQLAEMIETRNYINQHFEKELSLNFLSDVRFTSKFHFIRLFKKYYGQTPRQYILDKRIAEARLLLEKGKNVTEVCFEVGFDTPSSFSTLFKSRVGISPIEFRKRATFTK